MLDSRIAVQHLNDEPVDDRRWCQKTISPPMTGLPANVVNSLLVEVACKVLSKMTNRGNNPLSVSSLKGCLREQTTPTWRKQAF